MDSATKVYDILELDLVKSTSISLGYFSIRKEDRRFIGNQGHDI